jgi:type IV secretion system protein VirB10
MSEPITAEDYSRKPEEGSHRFLIEPKKQGPSRLIALAGMFGVILLAILLALWFSKTKWAQWKVEHNAAQETKQAAAAESTSQRKGRTFDDPDANPPTKADEKSAESSKQLPNSFDQPAPNVTLPPIPLTSNAMSGQSTSTVPSPPLMLSGENKSRPATVQDQARLTARKTLPSKTEQASAAGLGDRSFVITRGSYIPCVLQTQLFSNVPGQTGCIISENIYSDDGSRLLVPRGSTVVGEYGQTMRNGDTRIAVVWNRIKTTDGYVIDVDSGAADSVGTMGIGGNIDNRWGERIGAPLLLSLVDDAVDIAVARQSSSGPVYGSSTTRGTKSIAEKVLDSTINIKPTLSANRGARLMIYVSKDLWFDEVYGD